MGGMTDWIEARTITDLQRETQAWAKHARDIGMTVHSGWDRERVEKTETGYRIAVHAHT